MLSYFRIEMKIKQVISRRLVPFHKRACKPSQMPHDYGSDVVATPIQIQHSTTEASRARTPGNAHSRARMKTEAHSFITIIIMINKEAQNDCEQRRKDRYRRYQATDLFQTIWNNKLPSTLLTFYRSRCTIYMSFLIYKRNICENVWWPLSRGLLFVPATKSYYFYSDVVYSQNRNIILKDRDAVAGTLSLVGWCEPKVLKTKWRDDALNVNKKKKIPNTP